MHFVLKWQLIYCKSKRNSASVWFRWVWGRSSAWASIRWFSACATAFINARGWFVWPCCYWIINTDSTIVDFHSGTWFLCVFCIAQMFEVHKTESTRSASLLINNSEVQIESFWFSKGYSPIICVPTNLCIEDDVDSFNFAKFSEYLMDLVFGSCSTEPKYAQTFWLWRWLDASWTPVLLFLVTWWAWMSPTLLTPFYWERKKENISIK